MSTGEQIERSVVEAVPLGYGLDSVYTFSLEQYERMVANGSIAHDDRVELLNGILVKKMGKNPPHSLTHYAIEEAIRALLPPGYWLRHEEPLRIAPNSEPEPDLSVVRGNPVDFGARHPSAEGTMLVVEISDASLAKDRGAKGFLYAGAGIPEYWIVNLVDRHLERYSDPSDAGYHRREVFRPDTSVTLTIDGRDLGPIDLNPIFPPA